MVCGGREQRNQVFIDVQRGAATCELYIVCQNLAPRNAYQYNASIKETIAISVKYYTVFPFSFVHCLIGGTLWAHNTVEVTGKCDNLYEQKIPLLEYGQK